MSPSLPLKKPLLRWSRCREGTLHAELFASITANLAKTTVTLPLVEVSVDEEVAAVALAVVGVVAVVVAVLVIAAAAAVVEVAEAGEAPALTAAASVTSLAERRPSRPCHGVMKRQRRYIPS